MVILSLTGTICYRFAQNWNHSLFFYSIPYTYITILKLSRTQTSVLLYLTAPGQQSSMSLLLAFDKK